MKAELYNDCIRGGKDGYKEGILAARSILSDFYKRQNGKEVL